MDPQRESRRSRPRRRSVDLVLLCKYGDVRGYLLDLSVSGCGAVFEKLVLPDISVGDEVELEFRSLLLLAPIRVKACVRRIGELSGRSLVGLEFLDPDEVAEHIPFVLSADFDRRRQPRAVLSEDVKVRVLMLELQDKASLIDLSTSGARLGLGSRLAFRIHQDDRVELQFRLPERDTQFWIFAHVLSVRLADDQVSCSVYFDTETTVDFEKQRAEIEKFVGGRRRAPRVRQDRGGAA